MGTNGVDLSIYNHGTADITKIDGCDFAIAKVTEGVHIVDTSFDTWAQQAKQANLTHFGGYHFFHAETMNAVEQANNFLANYPVVNGRSIWVDYENAGFGPSGQSDASQIGLFIYYVKYMFEHQHGVSQKVGIYSNGEGWNRIRPYMSETGYNALWYAKPTSGVDTPGDSTPWALHQYSQFDGIDRDYAKWSKEQWVSLWQW